MTNECFLDMVFSVLNENHLEILWKCDLDLLFGTFVHLLSYWHYLRKLALTCLDGRFWRNDGIFDWRNELFQLYTWLWQYISQKNVLKCRHFVIWRPCTKVPKSKSRSHFHRFSRWFSFKTQKTISKKHSFVTKNSKTSL